MLASSRLLALLFVSACAEQPPVDKEGSAKEDSGTPAEGSGGEEGGSGSDGTAGDSGTDGDSGAPGDSGGGGDSAGPEPEPVACGFEALAEAPREALPATSSVGDFTITWLEAGAGLEIHHADLADRPVLRSASGGLVQGDQGLLVVEEHQGSFALEELVSDSCGALKLIQLTHSDIGGYTSLSWLGLGYDREAEQLMRWTEMSAFTAVMRTHEGNQPEYNAQVYDDEVMDHFARMSRVYRALAFYRAELMVEVEEQGWPLVRHLLLEFPDDPSAWEVDDQFMLGSEILVAPIKNKCWTSPWCPYDKEVYLPPGEWSHLWTGEAYGDSDTGTTVTVAADLGEPAVFLRRGSAVGERLRENLRSEGIDVPEE